MCESYFVSHIDLEKFKIFALKFLYYTLIKYR